MTNTIDMYPTAERSTPSFYDQYIKDLDDPNINRVAIKKQPGRHPNHWRNHTHKGLPWNFGRRNPLYTAIYEIIHCNK